jgi:hypothetical protein
MVKSSSVDTYVESDIVQDCQSSYQEQCTLHLIVVRSVRDEEVDVDRFKDRKEARTPRRQHYSCVNL